MADFRRLQNEKIFNPKLFPVHVNQVNVFHDDPREPGGEGSVTEKESRSSRIVNPSDSMLVGAGATNGELEADIPIGRARYEYDENLEAATEVV